MTKEEIAIGNVLIAKFLGLIEKKHGLWVDESNPNLLQEDRPKALEHNLSYHSSWDWLMLSIERINNIKIDGYSSIEFSIESNSSGWIAWNINVPGNTNQYQYYCDGFSILNSFKAVVEFIKWYNKN